MRLAEGYQGINCDRLYELEIAKWRGWYDVIDIIRGGESKDDIRQQLEDIFMETRKLFIHKEKGFINLAELARMRADAYEDALYLVERLEDF